MAAGAWSGKAGATSSETRADCCGCLQGVNAAITLSLGNPVKFGAANPNSGLAPERWRCPDHAQPIGGREWAIGADRPAPAVRLVFSKEPNVNRLNDRDGLRGQRDVRAISRVRRHAAHLIASRGGAKSFCGKSVAKKGCAVNTLAISLE